MKLEKARLFSEGRDYNASCKQNRKKQKIRTVMFEITYKIKQFYEGPLPDWGHLLGIRLNFLSSAKQEASLQLNLSLL